MWQTTLILKNLLPIVADRHNLFRVTPGKRDDLFRNAATNLDDLFGVATLSLFTYFSTIVTTVCGQP